MKNSLGTLGDLLLKDGKPLKEYLDEETGKEASKEFTLDVKKLNGLVKPRIKQKYTPQYNEEPSKVRNWNTKDIIRRNVTNMKTIKKRNGDREKVIEFIQNMDFPSFTVIELTERMSEEGKKWRKENVSSLMSTIFSAIGGESYDSPTLIMKEDLGKKKGNRYIVTQEFKKIDKYVLSQMVVDYTKIVPKDKKKRRMKKLKVPNQEIQVQKQEIKGQLLEAEPIETNLVELVKELRPGSVIKMTPDGSLTIVVM
jgi:hypothetical protein